jgi:hypothetical protein
MQRHRARCALSQSARRWLAFAKPQTFRLCRAHSRCAAPDPPIAGAHKDPSHSRTHRTQRAGGAVLFSYTLPLRPTRGELRLMAGLMRRTVDALAKERAARTPRDRGVAGQLCAAVYDDLFRLDMLEPSPPGVRAALLRIESCAALELEQARRRDARAQRELWLAGYRERVNSTPHAVTATTLWNEYEENEVAADAAYSGRRVTVEGVVSSVHRVMGDTMVRFLSPSVFLETSATMKASEASIAATLRRGTRVQVVCEGGAQRSFGSPHLIDCRFAR